MGTEEEQGGLEGGAARAEAVAGAVLCCGNRGKREQREDGERGKGGAIGEAHLFLQVVTACGKQSHAMVAATEGALVWACGTVHEDSDRWRGMRGQGGE